MVDISDIDKMDYDIACIYRDEVNRYPAQKTSQNPGEQDKRCMAMYKEAKWERLGYTPDSYCSGDCSGCQLPCFGFGDTMLEHESILDSDLSEAANL